MLVPSLRSFYFGFIRLLLMTVFLSLSFFIFFNTATADNTPVIKPTETVSKNSWPEAKSYSFVWDLPEDVVAVAVDVATSSDTEPMTSFRPPISEFVLDTSDLEDGTWFLNVQFKNDEGWGEVASQKLLIDNTPPLPFLHRLVSDAAGEKPTLYFEATDTMSGIDYYEVTISGHKTVIISPEEAQLGYSLDNVSLGSHIVRVVAVDKAGNKTNSIVPLLLNFTDTTNTNASNTNIAPPLGINWLIVNLVLVILVLFFYLIYNLREQARQKIEVMNETWEVQEQMQKIFTALRDEIYEQIDTLDKKPRLTKKEKEVISNLNKTLAVSETLIGKEIEDIKQTLK